jgi:hypothetical protein
MCVRREICQRVWPGGQARAVWGLCRYRQRANPARLPPDGDPAGIIDIREWGG